MNESIKNDWIAALRSGEYVQGRGRLRDEDDRMCCLAVLCDLHSKATGKKWEPRSNGFAYLGEGFALPKQVIEWAELNADNDCVALPQSRFPEYHSLALQNDDAHADFNRIADIIEKYL